MGTQRSGHQQGADTGPSDTPASYALLRLTVMPANLATFVDKLDEAALLFHEAQATDGGRIGCMAALRAVIDFCDRAGLGRERRGPLMQLFVALQSAEKGAVEPMLKVASRPNAPPLTEAEKRQRGCLAAAMEALIRDGLKPDDAARWVAGRSGRMIAASRVKTALWKAVKHWRVTAMGGDVAGDMDAWAFRVACEQLDKGIAVGPQGAEAMLKMAAAQGTIQESPPLT